MKIPNYNIINEIGSGGMGTVYLAKHTLIKRKVAIKSLHVNLINNKQLKERFKKEATALAQLEHPNIVRLNEYIEQQDGIFLIMEYVNGLSLDEHINKVSGPINEDELVPMFCELVEAFEYAHKNKIVHRDIKPSNIIVNKEGNVKVLDFGIAKIMDETNSMTKTGTQMGSVFYMSPEQVRGEKVNHLTDIYSLGVTLFQMATGKAPYDPTSNEYQVFQKIDKEPLPKASTIYPGVSEKLNDIIQKATSKETSNRYQSCKEFKSELKKLTDIEPIKKDNEIEDDSKNIITQKKTQNKSKKILLYISIILLIGIGGFFAMNKFISLNNQVEISKEKNDEVLKKLEEERIKNEIENDEAKRTLEEEKKRLQNQNAKSQKLLQEEINKLENKVKKNNVESKKQNDKKPKPSNKTNNYPTLEEVVNKEQIKNKFSFKDWFGNELESRSNWDVSNAKIENHQIEIIGNNYDMEKFNTSCIEVSIDFNEENDFLIETLMDFTKKGTLNNGSGLIFFSDKYNNNFYAFTINRGGSFRILNGKGGFPTPYPQVTNYLTSEYETSEFINKGLYHTNKLKILKIDDDFKFYINDKLVFIEPVKTFKIYGNYFGYITYERNIFESNYFKIENL